MSSEEFSEALKGDVEKRRLQNIDLTSYDFGTVLVDPPRAGLDALTLNVVSQYPGYSTYPVTQTHSYRI